MKTNPLGNGLMIVNEMCNVQIEKHFSVTYHRQNRTTKRRRKIRKTMEKHILKNKIEKLTNTETGGDWR